jgi:hypothetical protein
MLVIEADDLATRRALTALKLPPSYEIIVAPHGWPRTKPRALNVALPLVRGEFVAIFDAEDAPAPRQLRDAAERFLRAPPRTACLQAQLCIDNTGTRLFAIEYAVLFDVMLQGMSSLRLPLALGGSSNHFRTAVLRDICAWDAWNVTEDADIGLRLARLGYRCETLQSTTDRGGAGAFRRLADAADALVKGVDADLYHDQPRSGAPRSRGRLVRHRRSRPDDGQSRIGAAAVAGPDRVPWLSSGERRSAAA